MWTRHFWLWSFRVDVPHIVREQHLQRKHWICKCLIASKATQSVFSVREMYCDTNYIKWWTISVWKGRFLRDPCALCIARFERWGTRRQQNIEITREKLHIVVVSLRRRRCRYRGSVCAEHGVCVCVSYVRSVVQHFFCYTYSYIAATTHIHSAIKSEEKKNVTTVCRRRCCCCCCRRCNLFDDQHHRRRHRRMRKSSIKIIEDVLVFFREATVSVGLRVYELYWVCVKANTHW